MVRALVIILLIGCFSPAIYGQTDEPYNHSQQLVKANRYDDAIKILQQILMTNPDDYDALFLRALISSWQGEYQSALNQFEKIAFQHSTTQELAEAITRTQYWSGNFEAAIVSAETSLTDYPKSTDLMFTKAQALAAEGAVDEAIIGLKTILDEDPQHEKASALLERLEVVKLKNSAGVEYTHARFSNLFAPWHQFTAFYKRKLPSTLLVGRVRHASMFDQTGTQVEVDAYPKLNKMTYAYLNIGASGSSIFPTFRWGAELFRELPNQWEASAGMRGLYFEDAPVHIYTLHAGRYFDKYWFSARGFLTRLKGVQHMTGLATIRRYFANEDHFASMYLGSGATPLQINSFQEIQRLNAQWLRVDYQYPFQKRIWLLRSSVGYQHEVYPEVRATDRLSFSIQVERRF